MATATTIQDLATFGPERCQMLTLPEALSFCRKLVRHRYENFSVLSCVVPGNLRDDFTAVYAFCRWADDLGDEVGDAVKSLELLSWWRSELEQCFAGSPRHPVFVALRETVHRHDLPIEPFHDLICAFEQDQNINRYQSWQQLLGYCALSANPVGRLVLMLCGEKRDPTVFTHSDEICTALQLTNHWQDVRRDILERDRIYIPAELIAIENFEERLKGSATRGYAVDRTFLGESRELLRECVRRTWPLYQRGANLLDCVGPATEPIVWLLASGGQRVLQLIEMWNYETVLHRPRLSYAAKLVLIARAWLSSRFARRRAARADT